MDTPVNPDPRLWHYLKQAGNLDLELLEDYRNPDKKPWRQLGEILIREGMITVKQIAGLLNMQIDEPNMRIGDLAIREGMINESQLKSALKLQRETCSHPLELLIDDERIEAQSLLHSIVSYVRHLEGIIHHLRRAEPV